MTVMKAAHRIVLLLISSVLLAIEGIWGNGIYHHWTFISVIILAVFSLGYTVVNDLSHKSYCSFLSNAGLLLVLSGRLFGAPDRIDANMLIYEKDGRGDNIAIDASGNAVALPFSILLQDFNIDFYEGGNTPKQYTSTLSIDGRTLQTSVNHPCRYKGYWIYQSDYEDNGDVCHSVLKIVRDPWLPLVAAGILMLLSGALLSLKTVWRDWRVLAAATVLAAIFAAISIAGIRFGTLPPALRSLWFIPHLIIYMLAYSILALSVIAGIASHFTTRIPGDIPENLLSTASSLLLVGMICGAIWAKQAWGDYWNWDAKECWAAVTWLLTLAGTLVRKKKIKIIFAVIAFLSMQITWYGVNYLPAAARSLHTYGVGYLSPNLT